MTEDGASVSDQGSGRGHFFLGRRLNAFMALLPSSVWFYVVAVCPFVLIVLFRGWDETFRSGDAYLYLLGLTIAVVGENVIELFETRARGLKELAPRDRNSSIVNLAVVMAAAVWGFVLVVTQPKIHHPTTSWMQVAVFFAALSCLASARFSFKGKESIFSRVRIIFGPGTQADQTAKSTHTQVAQQPKASGLE